MFRGKRMRIGSKGQERGVSMPELALGGVMFFTAMFGIIEFARAMVAYNALSEGVRRGARYAALKPASDINKVKNMVVYGTETTGTTPIAHGLTTANVTVTYTGYGMKSGQVKVLVSGYRFYFNVPLIGSNYKMKDFSATANAESAGVIPGAI
jgi:Flp pilus assembly protein TadG